MTHGDVVLASTLDSGKPNHTFAQGEHLHAVVPVPGTDLIVTTNSGDNTAKIISATDGSLIKALKPRRQDADGAAYDPSERPGGGDQRRRRRR